MSQPSQPTNIQTLKPIYLVDSLGEYAVMPDGSLVNIGGTSSPTFTVGGKALLFSDGSSTDGTIGNGVSGNFQTVYNSSDVPAQIEFVTGKNLVFLALNGKTFTFNADTGEVNISGDLVVQGTTTITTQEAINTDRVEIHQTAGN